MLLSDTRTSAGVDNISIYRKMHVVTPAPERAFVIQSAGNLATTQEVILGGQIAGEVPEIFLVYPEGNHIRSSKTRPFLQIGETQFGKFWLELAVHARADIDLAIKIALGSMLSTIRANLSVGPPFDLAVYRNDALSFDEHRIEADSDYLADIQQRFVTHLFDALDELPPIPWSEA